MHIYIGADHRGYSLKESLKEWLEQRGNTVEDMGDRENIPTDDYVDFSRNVAQKIATQKEAKGIVICGSGAGVDITANRTKGIYCCLGFEEEQVRAARCDDDINILAIAADFTPLEKAQRLVEIFLMTPFSSQERHIRRLKKIDNLYA